MRRRTASATPDPSSSNVNGTCVPTIPSAIYRYAFKVPAAGTLEVSLNNTLDWSIAVRDAAGDSLAEADGGSPEVVETVSVRFKKGQTISIDACNFAGEPQISPTGTFTFK